MSSDKQRKRERRQRREEAAKAVAAAPKKEPVSRNKKILFSLIPVIVLLVGAEAAVRLGGLDQPTLATSPLPEETIGLFVPDTDLFWGLKPNFTKKFDGGTAVINSTGLRAPEIEAKADNEYRILSMGESSTFGVGTDNHETYTERLGALLQEKIPDKTVKAINAGVSAYSSFQSLKFLELRGLELKPDLILFYHEVNDYLPSSLRNEGNTEIGVMKTDRQLYESRSQGLHRRLMKHSAAFRWLNQKMTYSKIQKFNQDQFDNPLLTIGLPDLAIPPRLKEEDGARTDFNEMSLGRRVSDPEREQNFQDLVGICKKENIDLVIIHPSYQHSKPHECMLTRFCKQSGALMFDAYPALHPPGQKPPYIDAFHPSRLGHERLAQGLTEFIMENVLTP